MSFLGAFRGKAAGVAFWRQTAISLAWWAIAAILAGCASFGTMSASDPAEKKAAEVRRLAKERWDALIAKRMDVAYEYLSPAARKVTTLEQYRARVNPSMYRSVRIDEVKCEAEICKVTLYLTYDHRLMKGITTPLEESWILDQGRFWFVYRS
jgi:hypothetical protein